MNTQELPPHIDNIPQQEMEQSIHSEEGGITDANYQKPRVTKRTIEDYKSNYLNTIAIKDRQVVYLDGCLHESLIDILHVTTRRKVNISSYVINIIKQHLEDNKDVINTMYNKRAKSPL